MSTDTFHNRIHATIECPLKKSTIAWAKCESYRDDFGCLCKDARDRLLIKGKGKEALQAQLQRIKREVPVAPENWGVEKKTRFYLISNSEGEVVHRATNQKEAHQYLALIAKLDFLEEENAKLWAILRDELLGDTTSIELEEPVLKQTQKW